MVAFTQSVHHRSFELLLEELPALARLSDTKFNLATKVLQRRFKSQPAADQMKMRELGFRVAHSASNEWIAARIRSIFNFDQG